MAYKEITALDADTTVALGGLNKKTNKPNPTQVEGYYLGSKEVASPKARSGKASIYIFKTDKGNIGVWGKTNLDRKMASAAIGQMTLVKQTGKQPTPNGDMYLYTVQQDASNTIEVSTASEQAPPDLDDNDEIDSNEDTDDGDYEAEEKRQADALSAAERKAKVQSLLQKRK